MKAILTRYLAFLREQQAKEAEAGKALLRNVVTGLRVLFLVTLATWLVLMFPVGWIILWMTRDSKFWYWRG